MSQPFEIRYAQEAVSDLKDIRKFDQQKILDEIKVHLEFDPRKESKSKMKAMAQPFWSQFRLRVDDFRVYYDVSDEPRAVSVLRVLLKTTQPTKEQPP